METMTSATGMPKTPTPVMVVAILNFISVFFLGLATLGGLALALFGGAMSANTQKLVADAIAKAQATAPNAPVAADLTPALLTTIGVFTAVICFVFAALFFLIGRGLMKGVKWTWYVQLGLSIIGLLSFPLGTIINAIILFFFFQPPTRAHFKV